MLEVALGLSATSCIVSGSHSNPSLAGVIRMVGVKGGKSILPSWMGEGCVSICA